MRKRVITIGERHSKIKQNVHFRRRKPLMKADYFIKIR